MKSVALKKEIKKTLKIYCKADRGKYVNILKALQSFLLIALKIDSYTDQYKNVTTGVLSPNTFLFATRNF